MTYYNYLLIRTMHRKIKPVALVFFVTLAIFSTVHLYAAHTTDEIMPGVTYHKWTFSDPVVVHAIEVDLADPNFHIEVGFPDKMMNPPSMENVLQISNDYDEEDHEVVAAINGTYGTSTDDPRSQLGTHDNLGRTIMGSGGCNRTYMLQRSRVPYPFQNVNTFTGTVTFADDHTMTVGLNHDDSQELIMYTPDWAPSTKTTTDGVEVKVGYVNMPFRSDKNCRGQVLKVRTSNHDTQIPADGYVLRANSGYGNELLAHVAVDDYIKVIFECSEDPKLNNHGGAMLSGNNWLVKDYEAWETPEDIRNPRTVIAWEGTKQWFVVVDGRQTGYSIGYTFVQMANFCVNYLGCEHAINLDGGGSSQLVVEGSMKNSPCETPYRVRPNALLLVKSPPRTYNFPLTDDFDNEVRELAWDDKFRNNPVVAFSPSSPGGDGYALKIKNDNDIDIYETMSIGMWGDDDYLVESYVYCDYRPEDSEDGYEFYGIFSRDDGNGNFDLNKRGKGNCLIMAYKSSTGRIYAGKVVDGTLTDLCPTSCFFKDDGWKLFRIEAKGTAISWFLDDDEIASITLTTHKNGRAGIGYHNAFTTTSNGDGAYFDNFKMQPMKTTVTFFSEPEYDGFVIESSENSNEGGTANSTNDGDHALRAGDNQNDHQYKTIVSFATASLRDDAKVTEAILRLRRGQVTGSNPFTSGFGSCYVDIKTGPFGGSATLVPSDFEAEADATEVATMSNAPNDGDWSEGTLLYSGRKRINTTGKTQFKIYFSVDDNDNNEADLMGWYSGDNEDIDNWPQLILTYY